MSSREDNHHRTCWRREAGPFNTGTAGVDVTPLRASQLLNGGAQGTGVAGEPGELVLLRKESRLTGWQSNTHTHTHHTRAHIPHTPQTSHTHITYPARVHAHTHIIESRPAGCLARSLLTFWLLPHQGKHPPRVGGRNTVAPRARFLIAASTILYRPARR